MPGPVCSAACSVASPISQASGISASGREHEEGRVPEVGQVVERDDDGPEGQAGEEDSSDHGRPTTLPTARFELGGANAHNLKTACLSSLAVSGQLLSRSGT